LLQKGAQKAHIIANEVLGRVRVKLGFEWLNITHFFFWFLPLSLFALFEFA
jgi:hypothetical protein